MKLIGHTKEVWVKGRKLTQMTVQYDPIDYMEGTPDPYDDQQRAGRDIHAMARYLCRQQGRGVRRKWRENRTRNPVL